MRQSQASSTWAQLLLKKPEILSRRAQTTAALTRLKPVWTDRSISLSSKIQLMRSLVTCIFLYACESWTVTAELQKGIQAVEMRCYRKIQRISYKRPCYQRGSPCQDPAGNRTTRRPPDHRKETQTAVARSCLPFIKSGQIYLARHSEKGEEDKADRGRGGKTTSGNVQAWSLPSPRQQWRTGKNEGTWL